MNGAGSTGELLALLFLAGNSLYDIRCRRIHMRFTLAFSILGILYASQSGITFPEYAAAAAPGFLLLGASRVSRGAVGCGDAIAVIVLSLFLDCSTLLLGCAVSMWFVLIPAAVLIAGRKKDAELPFIPFLFAGTAVILAAGKIHI